VGGSQHGQPQRSHHSQQVEPAVDDEILIDRAALTLAQVRASPASSSSSVLQRVYGAQHPPLSVAPHLSHPRSSSPTSLPGAGGSGPSTPYRAQRIGGPIGLGSSPESENTPSHLHQTAMHSATTTPTRMHHHSHHHHHQHHASSTHHQGGFRSADPVSSHSGYYSSSPHLGVGEQENKEQGGEEFYAMEHEGEVDARRRRQDQAAAHHASAASSQSKYEMSMTADERFAALLQQQEYLSFCEESGELSKEDARLLEARRQKEERRAVRRMERERESRLAASSSSSSPLPPPVQTTPSPGLDEEEDQQTRQAQMAFEAFQARAQAVLSGSRPHALSAASLNSLPHGLHSSRISAGGLSSYDSPSRSHSYSSALPTPPPSARSSHVAPVSSLQRQASLSRSEINSLPVFAYVQSPASVKRQQAVASLAAAHSAAVLTITTTEETSDATNSTRAITEATMALASAQLLDEEAPSCSICLCDYEVSEKLRALPCCHQYHAQCIDDWLQRSSLCPSCNYDCHDAM
jgi:hypothetical protein